MKSKVILGLLCTTFLIGGVSSAAAQEDHPFALVNVVDLFDVFAMNVEPDETFTPSSQAPSNWDAYKADPRLGNSLASITVDGDRIWVAGYWNRPAYPFLFLVDDLRATWYASLGIAEVDNILNISGYGAPYVKYLDSFQYGPGVSQTDSFTGLDYDPINKILYAAFDDTADFDTAFMPPLSLFPGATPAEQELNQQPESYIAAFDADPESATYGDLLWKLSNPLTSVNDGDRLFSGPAVDPFDGSTVAVPYVAKFDYNPLIKGQVYLWDTANPNDPPQVVNIKDFDFECGPTFYRQIAFDGVTGDMVVRNANATQWVPRAPADGGSPFTPIYESIEEDEGPTAGAGDGTANTAADPNDVQLIAPGTEDLNPGDDIVGPGLDGILQTVPAPGDRYDIYTERVIGITNLPDDQGDQCNDDPTSGFGNGPETQGQGVAYISASNLPGLDQDLVVANNRYNFGSGNLTDIRFFTLDGEEYARLEIPSSPRPDTIPSTAFYDLDYDEASGTLVIASFDRKWVYVFKAQVDGGNPYPRYDYTRNGKLNLADVAGLQVCFTGPEQPDSPDLPGGRLACLRMNSNSDFDVDQDDWAAFEDLFNSIAAP